MKDELIKLLEEAIKNVQEKEDNEWRPMSANAAKALEVMRGLLNGLDY